MKEELDQESLLYSYFTILAVFANDSRTTQEQLNGILAWGEQLSVASKELDAVVCDPSTFIRHKPADTQSAVKQLYNLVYMIYLDNVVDECEIEILMKYAEHLGFPQHIVGDIIKAILTAPADGVPVDQVKHELKGLLEASLQ